jgi:Fe(3+) dicitrate transport protein
MLRKQQGVGTGGDDFDLTVTGQGFRRDVAYRSQNLAFYVENLFRVTPGWTLVPGVRVELGNTRMDGRLAYYDPADTPRDIEHRYALAGIRSSLELANGAELYGGWSQAYRPQIMKDVLPASALERTDPELDDSRGWTAELGIRNRRGQRLSYDVGVFELRIADRFGTVLRADPDGTSYLYRTNVGTSRTRGVELSLDAWLLQRAQFAVWAHTATSYFDGRYTAGTVVSGGRNVDIEGNRIESVPSWISRSGLSLEGSGFSVGVLVSHTSSSYADALNTVAASANGAVGLVPAYTIVDLNGAYQVASWLRVRAGLNNLFDHQYFTKRPQFYPGPGIWPSDGRGFQVTAELRRWP